MSLEQMVHPSEDSKSRFKRLIPQFRLRTILFATSLLSLIFGLWGYRTSQQISVIKWVDSNGGTVGYDFHSGNDRFGVPATPRCLIDMAGLDPFASIHMVDLSESDVVHIKQLSRLPYLRRILLNNSRVTNISPLSSISRLIELDLEGTAVTDFSPIKNHDQLLWLTVSDNVSDDKLAELRTWLPNCDVQRASDP